MKPEEQTTEKTIHCPKCNSINIEPKTSFGGPAVYKQLVCIDCRFEGGTSRVYAGEKERVEREIVERFIDKQNKPDAVATTLASWGI